MQTVIGPEDRDARYGRSLDAGQVVFLQAQQGDCAYVVESGLVEIYSESDGQRQVIARLGANAIFGEMALLGDQVRSASAVAIEATRLLVVTPEHLSERLLGADPLTRLLLRTLVIRSRSLLRRAKSASEALSPAESPLAEPPLRMDTYLEPGEDQEIRDQAFGRLRIERELETALRNEEFRLYLQPIVRLADGQVAGFEALIRWIKPDGQFVSPGEFIPVAEQSSLINRIGLWVLQTACDSLMALDDHQKKTHPRAPPLFLNVNLSARQLSDPELLPALEKQALRLKGRHCRLKLEVTESLMIGNVVEMQAFIARCRELGLQVVLDDFGTGYCSLSYLHLFEVHTMKLDRSFVRGMAVSDVSEKVVRGIAGIAHDLGLDIVVEGVEEQATVEQARKMGIDYAQGYLFGRPAPLQNALKLLK